MSGRIENLGLEALTQVESRAAVLLSTAVMEGKTVGGYLGKPYINKTFKDAELVLRTSYDDINKNNVITGVDVHCAGRCIWNAEVLKDLTPNNADDTEKRVLVKSGSGLAVVNILKSDVLPTYSKGTKLRMQIAGFPTYIKLAEDAAKEIGEILKEKDVKEGLDFIFPTILEDRVDHYGHFEISGISEINVVKGKIKRMRYGRFEFDGKENRTFVIMTVGTPSGDLDLAVSFDTIDALGAERVVEGATIFAEVLLTGDVAIYEYEYGPVRDPAHDLYLVVDAIERSNTDRLIGILAPDCAYSGPLSLKEEVGVGRVALGLKLLSSDLGEFQIEDMIPIRTNSSVTVETSKGSRYWININYNQNNKINFIKVDFAI